MATVVGCGNRGGDISRLQPFWVWGENPELDAKLAAMHQTAKRISVTGGTQRMWCTIAGSVLCGRRLYGAECCYITERQFAHMRRILCTAMGDSEGRRPDSVRLLATAGGKWGPDVARINRMIQDWVMEYRKGTGWLSLGLQGALARCADEADARSGLHML